MLPARAILALSAFFSILATCLAPLTPTYADNCQFVLGFASLDALIPQLVGNCIDDEQHGSNGDALQHTTGVNDATGLLVWRKADNWTAYTDGYRTWINGPNGLQERLNTQRFCWEADAASYSLVPGSPACPANPSSPSAPSSSIAQLPILTILLGNTAASAYEQFAGPNDIGVVPAGSLNYFNAEAALIPNKTIGAGFESWAAGQPMLSSLQGKATYVAYDVEHWQKTPASEQQNIVGTVQNMSQVLHSMGFKFILVPDRQFDREYMAQLAPYADIIVLQGQRIESNSQDFHDQLLPLITAAKTANPNVKMYASVGTNNGATSDSMRAAVNTLLGNIDGIAIFSFGDQSSLNTLQQFVSSARQS